MTRAGVLLALLVALACSSVVVVESCGAMAFELPPEEPQPVASAKPRLLRREAGADDLGAQSDSP
jgi:hypothetical protein